MKNSLTRKTILIISIMVLGFVTSKVNLKKNSKGGYSIKSLIKKKNQKLHSKKVFPLYTPGRDQVNLAPTDDQLRDLSRTYMQHQENMAALGDSRTRSEYEKNPGNYTIIAQADKKVDLYKNWPSKKYPKDTKPYYFPAEEVKNLADVKPCNSPNSKKHPYSVKYNDKSPYYDPIQDRPSYRKLDWSLANTGVQMVDDVTKYEVDGELKPEFQAKEGDIWAKKAQHTHPGVWRWEVYKNDKLPYYDTTTLSPDERIAYRISDKVNQMYQNEATNYDAKVNEKFQFADLYTTNAYLHQGRNRDKIQFNKDIAQTLWHKTGKKSSTDPKPYHDPTAPQK